MIYIKKKQMHILNDTDKHLLQMENDIVKEDILHFVSK